MKIRSLLRTTYYRLLVLKRLNLIATLYLNLRTLPFFTAIKLPVICFGKIKFHNLSGRIIIDAPIKAGMIKIGYRWYDLWPSSYLPTQILIRGNIVFKGRSIISGGVVLNSFRKNAEIIVERNVTIGGGTVVKALKHITIGIDSQITGDCIIMDSNMHYIKDIKTGKIPSLLKEIIIGKNCWINRGTTIAKGAILSDYTITARNTYISKDMTQYGSHVLLAGSPAKPVRNDVQRIFDLELEKKISSFYKTHKDIDLFKSNQGIELENEDFINLIY